MTSTLLQQNTSTIKPPQSITNQLKTLQDAKILTGVQKIQQKSQKSQKNSRQKKKKKHKNKDRSQSSNSRKKSKKHRKHKRKHSESERSRSSERSRRKKRDRSRQKKKYRERSNSRRNRRRSRQRLRSKDRSRSRSQEQNKVNSNKKKQELPKQIPFPVQIPMPLPMIGGAPGQRKKRQRSRSPREYYRKNQSGNEGEFWDSFSWQPKLNLLPTVSNSAYINTKKMRRIQITNIPIQMGLTQNDINQLVTKYMIKNYLNDSMNNCPIVNVQISEADRSVAIELSSVEQTCRLCKLQKLQLFKGNISRIIRLGDSIYGASIVTQAQTAAQAMAAAFGAINIFQNKSTNFSVNSGMASIQSSSVLRITNAVTPYMCDYLNDEQWKQFYDDLMQGFSLYGKIKHNWFVKKSQKMVGAEPGNLFVQYQNKDQAEKAMRQMQDRKYDERNVRIYFIPEDIYQKHFKPACGG